MQRKMRSIVVGISDLHSGHRLGLMNPGIKLPDLDSSEGYTPQATAGQRQLWAYYVEGLAKVGQLAGNSPIHLIVNGDPNQGDKHKGETVTTRMADQPLIAIDNLLPWLQLPGIKTIRLSIGTDAHEFDEGSASLLIADGLKARRPNINVRVVSHGRLDVDGLVVDYAHHGPPPGGSTNRGNSARMYLRDLMMKDIFDRKQPPGLVLRSHYHDYTIERLYLDIGDDNYDSTIIVTPPLCLPGAHGRKASKSTPNVVVGMIAAEIVDGKILTIHRLVHKIDIRVAETV